MRKTVLFILLITQSVVAQTIKGTFLQAKNTEIVVKSFEGFIEKELTKTTCDSVGNFTIHYPIEYTGAALLQIQNTSSVIVLLNHENFEMQWENFQDFTTLKFINSPENEAFAKGIAINQETEQKLTGLRYLLPLYQNNTTNENWLQNEISNQDQIFEKYIESLPKESYVKHYLSYRKFLMNVQLTNERYKELNRVKQYEIAFKKFDFESKALWNSGLIKEILSSYYQMLELYQNNEIILKKSIEANNIWLTALENRPINLQEVAEFCFTLLETKNMTKASEHIALSLLKKDNCQLTDKQTHLFEQYRKLAIGKTAPNFVFENKEKRGTKQDLKHLKNAFKLVVFGASWCPNCQTDYPSLVGKYKKLKEKYDLEVIYVALDTDIQTFRTYYKEAPFITFCDAKGWETQAAKEYYVFATPTYILLNKDLKILAKYQSPEQFEDWFKLQKINN